MRICLVVARAGNRVIGFRNELPWRISADLKHFQRLTTGRPVIMGRKTFEHIVARNGGPLPERINIVMSRNPDFQPEQLYVVRDLASALRAAETFTRISGEEDVMVIGGAEIYAQALPAADRIFLTEVHAEPEGDAFFPELEWGRWREVQRVDRNGKEKNCDHPHSFVQLDRAIL